MPRAVEKATAGGRADVARVKVRLEAERELLKRPPRRDTSNESRTDALQQPWFDVEYLPRILPHTASLPWRARLAADALQAFRGGTAVRPLGFWGEALSRNYPWCTVGKVLSGGGEALSGPRGTGTSVLVRPNLMLTASHVAPWDPAEWWMLFSPGYRDGADSQFGQSFVEEFYGYRPSDERGGIDYVICKLFTPLGNRVGWMGSCAFGEEDDCTSGQWQ